MENLTTEEYQMLLDLVEGRQESIRKESYTDKVLDAEYTDLNFIIIKLNAQLELLNEKK